MKLRLRDTILHWGRDPDGTYRAGDWYIRRSGRWWRLHKKGTDLSLPGTLNECKWEAQCRENR